MGKSKPWAAYKQAGMMLLMLFGSLGPLAQVGVHRPSDTLTKERLRGQKQVLQTRGEGTGSTEMVFPIGEIRRPWNPTLAALQPDHKTQSKPGFLKGDVFLLYSQRLSAIKEPVLLATGCL